MPPAQPPPAQRLLRSLPAALSRCAQYIIFKISDDKKFIEIERKGEKGDSFEDTFNDFTSKLPDGDCRYAVLDVEIKTKAGTTANKLVKPPTGATST